MIILDACVLIAHFNAKEAHHEKARKLLVGAAPGTLAASAITLAEVLVLPARIGKLSQADSALTDLGIRSIPLPADAHVKLTRLRADTTLKLPDCCVLLAAQSTEATAIATFDDKLAASAKRLGFDHLG